MIFGHRAVSFATTTLSFGLWAKILTFKPSCMPKAEKRRRGRCLLIPYILRRTRKEKVSQTKSRLKPAHHHRHTSQRRAWVLPFKVVQSWLELC